MLTGRNISMEGIGGRKAMKSSRGGSEKEYDDHAKIKDEQAK